MLGMDRSDLPESFLALERQKSALILEANLLQQQGQFEAAADQFAISADMEEQLARQLVRLGKLQKSSIHLFSALSCRAQAGDLHHALVLGEQLLQSGSLSSEQRNQISTYLETLRNRLAQWMRDWKQESLAAD